MLPLAESPRGMRADSWDLPLFLHVLGAMVMVGALATAAYFLLASRRGGTFDSLRTGFRALLWVALPAYLVMRIGAEWIADKEGWNDVDPTPDWIGIGYGVSDIGLLLILTSTIVAGIAVRRVGRAEAGGVQVAGASPAIAGWLTAVVALAYVVAVWAMTTKPG